ncbi:protein rep [Staphylococcus aureus]|uniref:protein rep n=3 Tax=Staphylococcus aureus TaxID=1280 RepID=UPI0012B35DC5|nr:protein rep [Staphylococcus aureus]MSS98825.1 replication protein [Staphylococcus aureus]MST23242.1 replication protein [Staphylococcus aureus]
MFPNHASPVKKKSIPSVPSPELVDFLYDNDLPEGVDVSLASVSARDSVWDKHRLDTLIIQEMYAIECEFERYSERMTDCSGWLKFGFNEVNGLVLKQACFCRVRYCGMCQWRRSLLWKALMYKTYDEIMQTHPTHRFVFLTLTVRNPKIEDLRETLQHMNKSWQRLIKRKEFMAAVKGWVRTTEVTRPKDPKDKNKKYKRVCPTTGNTHAHPHFHVILMVDPSYFGRNYIKRDKWQELWADCLRVDYMPQVDIRTVKPRKKGAGDDDGMRGAIAETLKYAVKPDDIMHDNQDPKAREWFYELTRQTHRLRFVATGGLLKNALKPDDDITNDDLIDTGNDDEVTETDGRLLNFTWYKSKGGYLYNPIHNE